MPLTKLASEILLQILSDKSLEFSDLCNVMLSCKRLSELSLVLLYKDLKFYCQTPRSDTRLDQLSASLERRPDRAQYVKSLDVSWRSIDSLIFTKISELLQQLPSLIRVKITEKDLLSPLISVFRSQRREEGDMTPADIIICSASAQSLRSVTIDDDKITCSDIVNIFKLSNLEAVTISNFNSQLHREPNFDFAQKESWGESRIKEFKVLKSSPPSGELVRYMLAGHPALEKLTWDVSYKLIGDLSPSGMMVALSAVKDHICEIDLSMPFYYQEKETCLDFSEFPHLRKLKTHDRLFFPFNSTRDKDPFLYYQSRPLSRLLPPNLGSLEMIYDSQIWSRRFGPEIANSYLLSMDLAEQKSMLFPRLSNVLIVERKVLLERNAPSPTFLGTSELDLPVTLRSRFEASDTKLKILRVA